MSLVIDCVAGATSWIETTKKSLVVLAAAMTGRNCVATTEVIWQIFDPVHPANKGKLLGHFDHGLEVFLA